MITAGGVPVLILTTQFVIDVEPWYAPQYLIPLAGMIFANAMNAVSIAAERYQAERDNGHSPEKARHIGMQAAMIPLVNSLMAVGLVSLPGMMTGQVLSCQRSGPLPSDNEAPSELRSGQLPSGVVRRSAAIMVRPEYRSAVAAETMCPPIQRSHLPSFGNR